MEKVGGFLILLMSCLVWPCPCPVSAQSQIEKLRNAPRAGDELYKYAISPWVDGQVIDLRRCKLDAVRKSEKYVEMSDSLRGTLCLVDNGTLSYCSIAQDTLCFLGFENRQMNIKYMRKMPVLTYPLTASSTLTYPVQGEGYCGEIPVKCSGQSISHVESLQELISPQGDVFSHPLLVSREENLSFSFGKRGQIVRKVCRRFRDIYVPDFRYPVVREYEYREEKGDTLLQCFYYPIDEQAIAHQVAKNKKVDVQISDDGTKSFDNHVITYQFIHDENSKTVNIRYFSESDCKLSFVLSSVSGIVYHSVYKDCKVGEENTLRRSYEGLRSGQYAVGIIVGEERHSETFHVK